MSYLRTISMFSVVLFQATSAQATDFDRCALAAFEEREHDHDLSAQSRKYGMQAVSNAFGKSL